MNVANKPDKNNVRQRTPPSELILFWSHVTSVFQGLSLSRSVGRVGENPGNEVAENGPGAGGRGTSVQSLFSRKIVEVECHALRAAIMYREDRRRGLLPSASKKI